ncbi:MAG: Fe2+-dependent dioxygenase, partial [Pseudomonadota bacterium]
MMHHIPSVLTRAAVGALRSALDGAGWVDGRATVGAQGAQVKRNRQLPEHSALARELGQRILARLEENALFFASALPLRIVPPLFNCYAGGEQYGAHVDGAVRRGAPALRTDVSVTLFLCDPADYDGGELVVHDSYGVHEVKLDAGDMILYPSSSVHQVLPVTRGRWSARTLNKIF